MSEFVKELENLINRHSKENGSNTPDFILAGYLNRCLGAFEFAVNNRDSWYGRKTSETGAELTPNTGSPKLPTWKKVYKWAMDSHGTPDLDQGRYAILRGCYDYMCRQLRAGAR